MSTTPWFIKHIDDLYEEFEPDLHVPICTCVEFLLLVTTDCFSIYNRLFLLYLL